MPVPLSLSVPGRERLDTGQLAAGDQVAPPWMTWINSTWP